MQVHAAAVLFALSVPQLMLATQDKPRGPFRFVPRPAEAPPPSGPDWHTSLATAEADAKEHHRSLLLYFTATW